MAWSGASMCAAEAATRPPPARSGDAGRFPGQMPSREFIRASRRARLPSLFSGLLLVFAGGCLLAGCTGSPESGANRGGAPPGAGRLFTLLPPSYTGVRFENRLTDTRDLNVFTYRNYYNGGGVALGDLTGDGLPEILLTSNQGGNPLYLDEGKFRFPDRRANELYINQGLDAHGVPTFVEQAAAYGVADSGYSTQAVFFDYDRDGD